MREKTNQILVVDDEIEIQRLFLQRFRKKIQAGEFNFLFATNGIEALKILRNTDAIDMVLTDIRMPEMDGLSLLGNLTEFERPLKAIVVSAFGDMKNIRVAMNRGAFDFVTKPIDFNDLEITIDRSLASINDLRQQQQALEEALDRINTQKESEMALSRAKEVAEAANRAKSAFLATMSHEIRTPMNGVLGMAQILVSTDLNEEQMECVQIIMDSGDALLAIINDILDFSKIESGMMTLEESSFNLKDMLNSVCNLLSKQAQDREIILEYSIHPDVHLALFGDSLRLRQILVNIVGNAIKFTHKGTILVSVDMLAVSTPENPKYELMFTISDTGIGIQKDTLSSLFQHFTQADASTTRKYGGTGLGLAISKRLVELMGGTIWVQSFGYIGGNPPLDWHPSKEISHHKGSTFYFTLKFEADPKSDSTMSLATRNKSPIEITPASNIRILMAEDNLINQKLILLLFRKLGYDVDIANNGFEVLKMLEQQSYDLILMDIQMPDLDGIATTQIIRQTLKTQPWIVALTASALLEDREACLSAGMDDYITKPIKFEQVVRALSNFIITAFK